MKKRFFRFCPNCKAKLKEDIEVYFCLKCHMEIYKNSSPTASAIILKNKKILLATRAIDPKKGDYDMVGGFLKNGEHPEKGLLREIKEETNLDVKIIDFLGVYIDEYDFQEKTIKTLNFYYIVKILQGKMQAKEDVASLSWFDIKKLPKKLAFKSQYQVLKDFIAWYKKNKT